VQVIAVVLLRKTHTPPLRYNNNHRTTGLEQDEYYLYNHLKFRIMIRHINHVGDNPDETSNLYHITGFEVYPVSITHDLQYGTTCYGIGHHGTEMDEAEEEEEVDGEDDGTEGGGDGGGGEDDGTIDDGNTNNNNNNEGDEEGGDDGNTVANENEKGDDESTATATEEDNETERRRNRTQRRRRLQSSSTKKQKKRKNKYEVINDPTTYLKLRLPDTNVKSIPILYTYEVEWIVNPNLDWSDRWDIYLLGSPDDDIHFFAILNSFMIVLFLTGAIAMIMIRTLRKDIVAYNAMDDSMTDMEETGWKLVHGDVFRPPSYHPMILAVLVGTGTQIGTAIFSTMIIAVLKIVNPIKKGQTLTAIVILYVFSGCVSGYVSARIHKFYDLKSWKMNTLLTATTLPGLLVGAFTILNIILSFHGAATAVSIWLLLGIFALWVCVSSPLVFIGAYFGYHAEKVGVPVKTNHIARFIPKQPWYTVPPASFLLGGILPFGSVCIELFFILSALWLHQIYYVMGFLLVVLLILAATCAQVSIVMDYVQLCAEDYRWWWKSFGNCASAGFYLYLYSLWFLVSRLKLAGILPVVIYLTYMFLISLCFGLCCGSIGFFCAFWFNRQIYGALKVD
jgi:Endomembrane protein 70